MNRLLVITVLGLAFMLTPAWAADESLILYLPLDAGEGSVAKDASSYENDGEIVGNAQWVEGMVGGALEIVGGSRVEIPEIPQYDVTGEMSLLTWMRTPAATTTWARMIDKSQWQNTGFDLVLTLGATIPRLEFFVNGTTSLVDGTTAVDDNEWHFIAATFGEQTLRIYVDGVMEGEAGSTGGVDINPNDWPLFLGAESSSNGGQQYTGALDEVAMFNRVLAEDEILDIFLNGMPASELAASPQPEDKAIDTVRDVVLTWEASESAQTHDVYFGQAFDDVATASVDNPLGVLASGGQAENQLDVGRLDFGATYYWRVDEVNGAPDFTSFQGEVWSFTIEPFSIPIAGVTASASSFNQDTMKPENTVNGSGLNALGQHNTMATDMWLTAPTDLDRWIEFEFDRVYKLDEARIWNQNQAIESFIGFGAKDVTIETSLDRTDWTPLVGVPQFAQGPSITDYDFNTTVDLGGQIAQYLRMTVDAGWGVLGQVGLSEVRTLFVPTYAREPQPAHGALADSIDVVLGWRLGRDSTSSEVYLGTDSENLENVGTASEASFDTHSVDPLLGETYFWQVHETDGSNVWGGPMWSFTTPDVISVDDFESYRDEEFLEIWATWLDGFDDPANGSLVGNGVSGSPETGIVQAGRQSLPLDFGNGGAQVSEATRTFDQAQDWTRSGVQSLVLYLNRGADNTGGGQVYVKINDTKILYEGGADLPPGWGAWTQWTIDLSAVADAARVRSLTIGIEGAGAMGVLYVDSIRLSVNAP